MAISPRNGNSGNRSFPPPTTSRGSASLPALTRTCPAVFAGGIMNSSVDPLEFKGRVSAGRRRSGNGGNGLGRGGRELGFEFEFQAAIATEIEAPIGGGAIEDRQPRRPVGR